MKTKTMFERQHLHVAAARENSGAKWLSLKGNRLVLLPLFLLRLLIFLF